MTNSCRCPHLSLIQSPGGAQRVGRTAPLADHPFQPQPASVGQQLRRRRIERRTEAHEGRCRQALQQLLQQRPARLDGLAPQVVAVEIRHVEQVIHDLAGSLRIEGALQGRSRVAAGIVDDDFAVIPARRQAQLLQRLAQLRQFGVQSLPLRVIKAICSPSQRARMR
jgi:hypothetical protein